MSLVGVSSDRSGERRWHLAGAALAAAGGWSLVAWGGSPPVAMLGLCLAQAGMMSMLPVFWTLPGTFLSGVAAAGGIALINSVANIGGFFGASILDNSDCGPWPGSCCAAAYSARRPCSWNPTRARAEDLSAE